MNISRAFPAFGVGFAAYYCPAFLYNWPAFTYFPAINEWHLGKVAAGENTGPPMYWFGWMFYAALVGIALMIVTLILPEKVTEKLWAVASWAAPLAAILWLAYEGRHWFQ